MTPQVADFGMARQLDVQSRIDTFSCGTITHTAPELMDEGAFEFRLAVFQLPGLQGVSASAGIARGCCAL